MPSKLPQQWSALLYVSTVLAAFGITAAGNRLHAEARIALQAVKVNPRCVGGSDAGQRCVRACDCASGVCGGAITPTSEVTVNPGGAVVAELFASDWPPDGGRRVQVYQVALDPAALITNDRGRVTAIEQPRCCASDEDCADLGVPCAVGFCSPSPILTAAEGGIFIDPARPEFIFFGIGALMVVDIISPQTSIRLAAIVLAISDGVNYAPPPKYLGTVALEASADASGIFILDRAPELFGETALFYSSFEVFEPLTFVPLRISVQIPTCGNTQCEPGEDIPSCPADCLPGGIPTVSSWGLAVLALLLLTEARRRFHLSRAT